MATIADIERRLAQIERELPFWRRQRGGVIAARWETEREGLLEQLAPFRFVSDPGALVLMDHAMETGWRVRMTSGEPPNTDSVMPFRNSVSGLQHLRTQGILGWGSERG